MTLETESPRQTMMRLSTSFLLERALYAVTKLNVADHLRDEAKTAKEIAKLVDVDPGVLHRLMRAVAGMGILHQDEDNAFSLTPLGEFLRTDIDNSVRSRVLFFMNSCTPPQVCFDRGGHPREPAVDLSYVVATSRSRRRESLCDAKRPPSPA